MKLSKFKFDLPMSQVAQEPAEHRHESKLMVLNRKEQTIEHKRFDDVLNLFDEDDVFVVNDTKVFPARLEGNKEKTGAEIEVFLLRELNSELRLWDVLVDPARKIRVGNKLYFGEDEMVAEVIDNTTSRGRTIRFLFDGPDEEFKSIIYRIGNTPLPKYIKREATPEDEARFQTIFANRIGAVSPPTAGLHFSRELMMRMEIKGIKFTDVTLHLGLGAFRPVEVEDLTKHKMDSEYYEIPENTVNVVNKANENKRKVVAVGSSVIRSLESSVSSTGTLNSSDGWTDKFMFPPYDFSICNAFITNFHAPGSTLMMLAAAFGGYDFVMEAYYQALKNDYKFMCYGDAMLII
jgi:S-adenosylmethionine:tRNA ribosyltransferase-isomerase